MKGIHKLLSLVLLALLGCTKELPPQEYARWVQNAENGLHLQKQVGEFVFDVQYEPVPYLVIKDAENLASQEKYQQAVKERQGLQYYTLKISLADKSTDIIKWQAANEQEYQQRFYYYSFDFQKDIYLEEEGRQLKCELFHFERSYDLKNERTFVLGFEQGPVQAKESVLVINAVPLQTGPVKIKFVLTQVPGLKL